MLIRKHLYSMGACVMYSLYLSVVSLSRIIAKSLIRWFIPRLWCNCNFCCADAIRCYDTAVGHFMEIGRLNMAARYCKVYSNVRLTGRQCRTIFLVIVILAVVNLSCCYLPRFNLRHADFLSIFVAWNSWVQREQIYSYPHSCFFYLIYS